MSIEKPLVSVITGYYNREHLVDESIQSLIDQTYENLEIIIFNDCSTDNTLKELKKFEHDPRVIILDYETNMGFTKGLKHAIEQSKGDYISIHGSGDYSYPDRIKKQVELILSNNRISAVGCEDRKIFKDGSIGQTNRYPAENFYSLMKAEGKLPINGSHVLLRKSYYDQVGGYRTFFKYAQDADLFCRLALISDYNIVPEILYEQKRHVEGSVSGDPIKRLKQILYKSFAVQCMVYRKKFGHDFIDIFGDEALAFSKPSRGALKKLSIHAFRLYNEGKINEFNYVILSLSNQKKTVYSLFVKLLELKIIPVRISKLIYNYLKK